MIHDLNQVGGALLARDADVVVIGGGIAGLILAERISRRHRVVVLESGPLHPEIGPTELDAVEQVGSPYRAPSAGRSRGLGGTSNKWGGALLPFQPDDFAARPDLDRPAWPVRYEAIRPYFLEVENLFGLTSGPYDGAVQGWLAPHLAVNASFVARYAKWAPFSRRNVATLLHRRLRQPGNLEVWLNATCSQFEFGASSPGLQSVTSESRGGGRLKAKARHFVLAAGAIESTRLLHWALAQCNAPRMPTDFPLGLYLHDHVSAKMANIETDNPTELNRLAGFRFHGGTMRSFRLELTADAQRRHAIAGGFAHISVAPLRASGFDALRAIMRGVQARRLELGALVRAIVDVPYLAQAAYWRLIERQLYWPRPAGYELHIVVEQRANAVNRISLGASTDVFGVPLARVKWQPMETEADAFRAIASCFNSLWCRAEFSRIGRLKWRLPLENISLSTLGESGDVFHPGGTTKMGDDPRKSVVNGDLLVWEIPNLSVVSTSTFPSGASANPTMTLVAFAMRLADSLASRLSRAS